MHSYTSQADFWKDWSTLQFLQLLHKLLIPQLHWKHPPKSHRNQCCHTATSVLCKAHTPGELFGISPALTRSHFAKIFFPSAYLLSVCNPQGSLHSSHTLQMTTSKLSHTHSFPWNSTAITLNCLSILSPRLHLFMNGDIHLPRRSFKFHLLIQQLNPISQSPADSTCLMPFKSIHFWWCLLSPVCFRFLSLLT